MLSLNQFLKSIIYMTAPINFFYYCQAQKSQSELEHYNHFSPVHPPNQPYSITQPLTLADLEYLAPYNSTLDAKTTFFVYFNK